MANTNAPFGLQWLGDLSSGLANGMIHTYVIPSSDAANYFVGDPVKSTGTSTSDGVPTVTLAAAGDTMRGVIIGFKFNPDNLNITYGAASTTRYVYVVDAPFAEFVVQTNGTLAITDIGANMDLAAGGGGSTYTGISSYVLDEGTVTASSAQMRLIRLYEVVGNSVGAYAQVVCMINEHELKSTAGV